jgi:isomerase DpgB
LSSTDQLSDELDIDCGQPLSADLIAQANAFCDRVEDAGDGAYWIIRLHRRPGAGDAGWPGLVTIDVVSKWERALRRVERLTAPTIAVAQGHVDGPALEVLLSADLRIASRDLTLSPPESAEGPWPGMFVHRLVNQVGVVRARRLVLFGGRLSAQEAVETGIVDEVTDDVEGSLAQARSAAGGLVGSEMAIRRRLMLDALTTSFEDALGAHLAAYDRALRRAAAL